MRKNAVILILAFICSSAGGLVYEIYEQDRIINKSLQIWEPELASAIIKSQMFLVDRIMTSFRTEIITTVKLTKNDTSFFSIPAMAEKAQCTLSTTHLIQLYGQTVGQLEYCKSPSNLISGLPKSITFWFIFIGIVTLVLAVQFFSLRGYKTSLLNTISYLKQWAQPNFIPAQPENELENLKSDPITAELAALIQDGMQTRLELAKSKANIEKSEIMMQVAAQVSHDIRSPLSALNMILGQLDTLPEQNRILVRSSVNRISDIANSLLNHNKTQNPGSNSTHHIENVMLASLVDSVVSEKRIAMREKANIQIEARLEKSYGLFAKINSIEMKRLISNAINNSSEAFGTNQGLIEVVLESSDNNVILTVRDNGKGIPPHVLAKLGQAGITHGKEGTESGSGLGVYHAKKTIESFGGTYEIKSTVGAGTSVIMTLKKEVPPNWFVQKIKISKTQKIIATDDDNSILEIWRQRFGLIVREGNAILETCSSGDCLRALGLKMGSDSKKVLYLIDYEFLGQKYNGLDLIEELGIAQNAILVSSRYEESAVKERCARLGVRMIPKGLAGQVPIEIEKEFQKLDGILIDDDPLIKMVWEMQSKEQNKAVLCFLDESGFFNGTAEICRETPIYIDVNLANGIRGQDVATRIHQLGFQNIHLSTGYDADSVVRPAFIRSVLSKDFPL